MWPRVISGLLGVWLTVAPDVLDYGGTLATTHHVAGPLIVAVAIIAAAEVMRGLRWLNAGAGAWLLVASSWLGLASVPGVNGAEVGLGVLVLATVRGRVRQQFGGGWRDIFRGFRRGPVGPADLPRR
jgi:hypothetical protein